MLAVPCRNVVRLAKRGLAQLARGGVFVVLHALEPDARADLMDPLHDLHIVGIGEQIAAVPDARGVVRARPR